MIDRLARPWENTTVPEHAPFGPDHCLMSEVRGALPKGLEYSELMSSRVNEVDTRLLVHPYPRRASADRPERTGFPVRLPQGQEPHVDRPEEQFAQNALRRMHEVIARVQELEEALDDPAEVWPRLRAAWQLAEDESDPRMAEIVRQARDIRPLLGDLEKRIRRILRRSREKTPLDQVREMDRASMRWLVRQPGRSIAERAGADQRILATVRRENFDTLENRVLRAYTILASEVARDWLLEHPRAGGSRRFRDVEAFRGACRRLARSLEDLGIGIAAAGITPNYVLMQDFAYRGVYKAWLRLLQRRRVEDDLWAWQAQTWTDFAVLAIVLALDAMPEAELVAQSPILWRAEAVQGRWFEQDRPLAVFWLRETGRIVEVQSRPDRPGTLLSLARAHVALRISDPARGDLPRRVAVWTPHAMHPIDPQSAARSAVARLDQIQRISSNEILRHGLIVLPAHGDPRHIVENGARTRVEAISLDASGAALAEGLRHLRVFASSDIYSDNAS